MQKEPQFADRLSERMNAKGFNQASLGRLLGTGQSTVNRWLNGTKPQPRMVMELAAALSVRIPWLLNGEEPMEPGEEERALGPSRMAGGQQVIFEVKRMREPSAPDSTQNQIQEQPSEYYAGQPVTEEQRLHREIMQRLNEASLSADELAREVAKRRVDEYFDIVINKKPRP